MSVFMRFIVGALVTAGGCSLLFKTEWYLQNFGSIAWFDQKLGFEGGSRLGYKLIGLAFCFFGIIYGLGMFNSFFGATAGKLLLGPRGVQE